MKNIYTYHLNLTQDEIDKIKEKQRKRKKEEKIMRKGGHFK